MANIINKDRPEVEDLKPLEIPGFGQPEDSRLKFGKVTHPRFPCVRTYCVNCGKPYGWTSDECFEYCAATQIIVICDECEQHITSKINKIPLQPALLCVVCQQPEKDMRHDPDGGQFLHPFTFPLPVGSLPSHLEE